MDHLFELGGIGGAGLRNGNWRIRSNEIRKRLRAARVVVLGAAERDVRRRAVRWLLISAGSLDGVLRIGRGQSSYGEYSGQQSSHQRSYRLRHHVCVSPQVTLRETKIIVLNDLH